MTPPAPDVEKAEGPGPFRTANVDYASALLETEIAQRNARKDGLEANARGVIAAAGTVLTLLVGLGKDAGLFDSATPNVVRIALVVTLATGVGSILASIVAIWPRAHERLGKAALAKFNDSEFLDRPTHEVTGRINAGRLCIVDTLDRKHQAKAHAFYASLVLLSIAFCGLLVQGVALAAHPTDRTPSQPSKSEGTNP